MRIRLFAIVVALIMAVTCFPLTAFAAGGSTYTGSFPELPNAIAKKAIEYCWGYGTAKSKYRYSTGKPVAAYKEALEKAYPNRSRWGKKPRAGASCDVFVGTTVRSSGYDTKFPRGLSSDLDYLPAATDKWRKVDVYRARDMQPGDVILYLMKGGGGHISIYVEIDDVGYIANAHYGLSGGTYGILEYKNRDFNPASYRSFAVYRAVKPYTTAFSRGDKSSEVKKLQEFLNWAGFSCGTPDGSYGPATEKAVQAFRKDVGLSANGTFDQKCLDLAKTYTIEKSYSGKYPAATVKFKKGTKTNIKRWQSYLKWYGYNIAVDGDFGKQTKRLTKKFQREVKLKADGVVGKKTIKVAKKQKR